MFAFNMEACGVPPKCCMILFPVVLCCKLLLVKSHSAPRRAAYVGKVRETTENTPPVCMEKKKAHTVDASELLVNMKTDEPH